ncbi:MAG: sigma-70 family RNA polymerase sigma factor [Pygmaiobacter massiliensis]|nr:sigma-70 family RNA polymerase sigma factor [Pygmaiobacter massiliensis]
MSDSHDADLLQQAKSGDEAALAALITRFMPAIRSMAKRAVCPGLDFEDAVQEGYIGLFYAVRTFRPDRGASFATYANTCIRNAIVSALRSAGRKKNTLLNRALPLCEPWELHDPEETAILKEQYQKAVSDINTKLSSLEKQALLLSLKGKSYGEIARVLSTTPKAVDNALVRVRRKLRGRP